MDRSDSGELSKKNERNSTLKVAPEKFITVLGIGYKIIFCEFSVNLMRKGLYIIAIIFLIFK